MPPPESDPAIPGSRFATTHWSLVAAARDRASPQAQQALAELCQAYWYPLYAFVRRQVNSADQAQDLTQEFFARLLEKDYLGDVDPAKGQFRSFLLASCKHFLANEWDKAHALKRGGGCRTVSLNFDAAESRYGQEPGHGQTPEKLFERRWALTLLDQVLTRLRDEHVTAGKERLFSRLKEYLVGDAGALPYRRAGAELGLSEGAVKVAVHRLRRRYQELLREEIGRTVGDPEQVEEEIRNLFAALGP